MKILPLLTTICMFLSLPAALPAAEPAVIDNSTDRLFMSGHMRIMEDKRGDMTPSSIMERGGFRDFTGVIPNFGFTPSVYWVNLSLANSGSGETRYLETAFPLLDRIDLFVDSHDGRGFVHTGESGRTLPFDTRMINHRHFVFPMNLAPEGNYDLLMRIKTDDGMIFPMVLWSERAFISKIQKENILFGIYYGIIIVMFLYNLFLFVSIRDVSYFYYILYIGSFGLFQLAMNGIAYQFLWPGNPWWAIHANPFFIGLSVFFAMMFSISFLDTKTYTPVMDRLLKILLAVSFLQIIGSFILPYSVTILTGQLLPLACILMVVPTAILCLLRGYRSARFYLIAWSTFLVGIVLSTLRVMGFIPHNVLTEHGLQIGSGIETVLLSLALADRINITEQNNREARNQLITVQNRELETLRRTKEQIEEANRRLSLSEEKYRQLVEGSNEVVFTLDENWCFITANAAIRSELNMDPESIRGKSFLDLLFLDRRTSVTRDLVREKMEAFSRDRMPIEFRAEFRSPISIEPRELHVRLEYLKTADTEILGRAYHTAEDSLLRYFQSERLCYEIGNFLITADEITHRLTRNLKRFLDPRQMAMVRLALREIIINAIEHGNLGVSFHEKTEAIMNDRYFEFISNRQHDPRYAAKKVHIEYILNPVSVTYVIRDEGEGFDHKTLLEEKGARANRDMLAHGRGITMATNVFDDIRYNESGNEVFLVKRLS